MRRNNIAFRRATYVAQKKQVELDDRMQGFLRYVIRMQGCLRYAIRMQGFLWYAIRMQGFLRYVIRMQGFLRYVIRMQGFLRYVIRMQGFLRYVIRMQGFLWYAIRMQGFLRYAIRMQGFLWYAIRMQGFLRYVIRIRQRRNYPLSMIGNMDETPVYVDIPGNYTLERKGMKSITMASTGHEKEKLTVMLAAMADGTKLLPMVVLKGVRRPRDIDIPAGIVVVMAPKSWANEEIMAA